jgi:translocation and assembly module TamB
VRKKILLSIVFLPFVLLGSLLIAGYFLIATELGTQWLLKQSIHVLPKVQIEGVGGRLIDEFTIQRILYINCDKENELNNIRVKWSPRRLINKVVELERITLGSANINGCDDPLVLPEKIGLPVKITLKMFELNDIYIINKGQRIDQVKGSIVLANDAFNIQNLLIRIEQFQAETSLSGKLTKPFMSTGELNWKFDDKNKTTWQGKITLAGSINEIQGDHSLLEPLQINSTVSVYTPLQQLKVILQNRWKSIGLPIGQPPQIILENGEFDVEGDLSSVAYRLNSNAKSQHLPSLAVVKLNGTANQELISIAELQINSNEGAITANGNVNLKPDLKASLSIQGKQFNPKFFVAEMPGKLDFNADVIASLIEHEVMAAIDLKSLTGKLRDYDINGFGKIHYSPDSVQAEKFNLIIGENTIKVNGKFGVDDNQADFKLVANNLTQLHPKFSGQIQGEGSFKGAIKSPHIRTTLKGENIKFNDQVSVATISIDGDVYVFGDKSSNVRIQASNITLKENIIDTVDLVATGSQKNHQVDLNIQGEDIASTFNLTGEYNNRKWEGSVNQLLIKIPALGNWNLVNKTDVHYGSQGFSLSHACLRNEGSSICMEGQSDDKGNWQSEGKLTDFPLQLLTKDSKEKFTIEGVGQVTYALQGKGLNYSGDVKVYTNNVTLRSPFLEDHDESLHIQQFELLGDIHPNLSKFDLKIAMDKGQLSGFAHVENIHDREKVFIRKSNFAAEFPSIKFLNVFAPKISVKEGFLNAQAEIHGLVKRPEIISNVKLSKLAFYIPDLGTEYTQGEISSTSEGWNNFNINGSFQSQKGKLDINGKLKYQDKLSYSVELQGDNFQVLHFPDKSLMLSPNLAIEGDTSNVNIKGEIDIPSAKLILKELPKGAVRKSSDEVLVSELNDETKLQDNKKLNVTGKIQLTFGDDVHFAGKGIQTDLAGDLLVHLDSKKVPSGQGVLKFNNATYQVLGQTLDISSGKMLFAGPISNPELDVKVTRTTKDVTAGMKIEGTVNKPQTRVFSNPSMSDGNALSYLMSGRPLNEASGSQNALIAKAALSLGVDKTASLTQQIASTVGLDESNISGGDEGLESTSLVLGKYLSPKLYVSYAYGLFSSVGTVGFDYQLTKKISVEAESGEGQSIDLLYTIERE